MSRCQSLFCEKEYAPLATSPMKGWAPRHSSHLWKCCPHNPSLPQNQAFISQGLLDSEGELTMASSLLQEERDSLLLRKQESRTKFHQC